MTKFVALLCAAVMALSTGTAIVFADETDEVEAVEEITEIVDTEEAEADVDETVKAAEGEDTVPEIPSSENTETTETADAESTEAPAATETADDEATEAPAATEAVDTEATETPAATETVDAEATETPAATETAAAEATEAPAATEPVVTEVPETKETTEKESEVQIEKTGINPFDDCQNAWFTDYVTFAYENGLIKGVDDNHFNPNGNITIDELAVILYRLHSNSADIETEGDNWADEAEAWVVEKNIMSDFIDDTNFDGDKALTREEVVSMIFKAYRLNNTAGGGSELTALADGDEVSEYALEAIKWSVGAGIIKGRSDKWIAPKSNVTRAEMATILQRYLTNLTFAEKTAEEPVADAAAEEAEAPVADAAAEEAEAPAEDAAAEEAKAPVENAAEEAAEEPVEETAEETEPETEVEEAAE